MQTYTRTYDAVWGFLDWNVDAADKSNQHFVKRLFQIYLRCYNESSEFSECNIAILPIN